MLKEGMDADLVLVDFTAPHLMPCHNVLTGLVYAAKGGDGDPQLVQPDEDLAAAAGIH